MLIIAIGWLFVVGLFALVHALSPQGSLLAALLVAGFVGVLPVAVAMALMAGRGRRSGALAPDPHGGSHAPGDAIAPEREET